VEYANRDPSAVEDEPDPLDTYLLTVDTAEDRYVLVLELADGSQLLPTWAHQEVPSYLSMVTILHNDLWVAPAWLSPRADVMVVGGSERQGWVVQVALQAEEPPKFDGGSKVGLWLAWSEFIQEYGDALDLVQ